MSDAVQSVLGEIQNVQAQLQIQRPNVGLVDPPSGKIIEAVKSDVPDLICTTGILQESDSVVPGASIHLRFRKGQPFKGEPALLWTINGEKGEIRLTNYNGPSINANSDDIVIEIDDHEKNEVQKIDWEWGEYAQLPPVAKNIAALYEAYAKGDASRYATFDHALKRHKQLDGILARFDQ